MSAINAGQVQLSIQFNMDQMADIHMCGMCKTQFTSIDAFLNHKRSECPAKQSHRLITSLFNATPSVPLPLPGAMITPVTSSTLPCTPSPASRQQRRKPILLTSTSPKVAQPATVSSASSSQPCGASTTVSSGQTFNNSAPVCSPELPQNCNSALAPSPSVAEDSARVTESAGVQETNVNGDKSTGVKGKGKGVSKPKCYKCTHEGCDFTTAHLKDIHRHNRIHTGDKPFTCSFCERRFTRKDKLQLHIRTHNGVKPFACELCSYAAVDGGSLKKHMRIHTKERPFKCQICTYASRNSSQLTIHLRTHTGDTPFHCHLCSAKFKISTDLRRHLRIHTGEKPFKCSQCSYASALNSNLKSHMKNNHLREKKFQCEDCTSSFCTQRQLRQHERTHPSHNPIKCLECDFLCQNKRAFRRHERTHSKAHKCPHCSFSAKYYGRISSHIKKVHPDLPKPKQAKKAAKQKRKVPVGKSEKKKRKPSRIQLSGKRPFTCNECEASFMRKDSFASHMRQHEQANDSVENTALAVLQLQQLPPLPPAGPASTTGSTTSTINQNQNNSSIFSELNAATPTSDIEMLLSVINSQAAKNAISSDPNPSINTKTSEQEKPRESTSQNEGTVQVLDVPSPAVTLQKRMRHSTQCSSSVSSTIQSDSITIVQPDIMNGDVVTLQVISHNDSSQRPAVASNQASAGFTGPGQQLLLRQLPVTRNQQELRVPQLQPEQQIAPTTQPPVQQPQHSSLHQTTSCLPVPLSADRYHRDFIPQFVTGSAFSANQDAVGNPSPAGNSLLQNLLDPTRPQGTPLKPPVHQSVPLYVSSKSSLTGNNLQVNMVQQCQPCIVTTSTVPRTSQQPLTAQQGANSTGSSGQFQTGVQSRPLRATACTRTVPIPASNTLQTLTTYSSWNSQIGGPVGQLHTLSQHQSQGHGYQHSQQQRVPAGIAVSQSTGVTTPVGHPLSSNTLTQQVVTRLQQAPSQQQQTTEQIKSHITFPPANILHIPQLAPVSACGTLMSPSVTMMSRSVTAAGDNINVASFQVRTQGTAIPITQTGASAV